MAPAKKSPSIKLPPKCSGLVGATCDKFTRPWKTDTTKFTKLCDDCSIQNKKDYEDRIAGEKRSREAEVGYKICVTAGCDEKRVGYKYCVPCAEERTNRYKAWLRYTEEKQQTDKSLVDN